MQVVLGNGSVEVVTIFHEGRLGVLLRPLAEVHPIGEFTGTGGEVYDPEDHPDHCTIWLDCLQSAHILQDAVNLVVLRMQGVV